MHFSAGKSIPKGPFRTLFSTESDSVVFYYSVVNLLPIVIHYSKYSKSVQNVVTHYIFDSESLLVVNSLQSSTFTTRTVFSMSGSFGFSVGECMLLHECAVFNRKIHVSAGGLRIMNGSLILNQLS